MNDELPVPGKELFPGGLSAPFRCRFKPVLLQDIGNRTACYVMPQVGQRAENPSIAPIVILVRQPNHQGFDLTVRARPSRSTTVTAVILLGNQFPMPGQQGLWRHKGCDFSQESPSQSFRFGSQTAMLVVIQPKPLATQLLAENAILFAEVFDRVLLLLVHPPV